MKNNNQSRIVVNQKQWQASWKRSTQPEARNWDIADLWYDSFAERRRKANKKIRGPFTVLNRALKGGVYPPIRLKTGTMEYFIVSGSFACNGEVLRKGDFILFRKGSRMDWASRTGGVMLVILRGDVEKITTKQQASASDEGRS